MHEFSFWGRKREKKMHIVDFNAFVLRKPFFTIVQKELFNTF